MTTTNVKTIKTSGGDYTSLENWQAGRAANLVIADFIEEAVCYAKEDPALTLNGWTTGPDNYIYIHTDSTARHAGVWDEAKFHMAGAGGVTLDIYEDYVRVDGLQVTIDDLDSGWCKGILMRTGVAQDQRISNTIVKGVVSGENNHGIETRESILAKIWNCIIYDFTGTGNAGYVANGSQVCYIYNTTVHNCTVGMRRDNGSITVKNNIAQDCGACYTGDFTAGSNNCSDDNTQPGTNGRNGEVAFVDEGGDHFGLNSADTVAHNNGVNLYDDATIPFKIDIAGNNRGGSGAVWDIGAWEVISGPFPLHFRV